MARNPLYDRVLETSVSTGNGNFILVGPSQGYRTFSALVGVGNACDYCIENDNGQWEMGVGTLINASTLRRDAVSSSSTGSLITFEAGTKRVFVTPSTRSNHFDTFYTHTQDSASATWTVTHNLGKCPSVTVVDSGGTTVYGGVQYTSANALVITFSAAFSGKAYLN